jgi:predicted dehydrogenase
VDGLDVTCRVKIHGAGSIGNHLAHASRRLGWDVVVCDVDARALRRMEAEIYPSRYGAWDAGIALHTSGEAPVGGFDLICIGTPPEHHLPLALSALTERPRAILIEKPLCPPSLTLLDDVTEAAQCSAAKVFVGYDHVVGKAARLTERLIAAGTVGTIQTIDVEFREHWRGIFQAHPWLSGPEDSYLGYWTRGGGASGEHSHALNLWQHFAHVVGAGCVADVAADLRYVRHGQAEYDDVCMLTLRTESGLPGRVVQDVITRPARKRARLQGTDGVLEWVNGYGADGDAVVHIDAGGREEVHLVPKRRPDDFIEELRHIEAALDGQEKSSPLDLERGSDTMRVLAAAHRSEHERRRITIDYGHDRHVIRTAQEPA